MSAIMRRESDSFWRVSNPADPLPEDIDALRTLVRSALAERDAAIAERDRAVTQNDRLRHLLRQLQRARFGRSSEQLDPDQLQLALEEIEQAIARGEAEAEKSTAPKPPRTKPRTEPRKSLPAHLPRIEVVITPEDTACPCCKAPMHVIGEEKSERLIKGGLPTEAMVAHVLVSKYAWHLPLYRQAQMLARDRSRDARG
jgi:transposase